MFTGIITHIGKLKNKNGPVFTFNADRSFCKKLKPGASVAVNGVCLTILSAPSRSHSFSVEMMPETQTRTMLGNLKPNDFVNLELPMTGDTFLSGHFVQGHVDAIGRIKEIRTEKNSHILTMNLPPEWTRYVVEKGSICINGISLTVISTNRSCFTVGIMPYTWKHTMLHQIQVGDFVNIEVDIVAKYLEKLLLKSKHDEKTQ